MKKHVTAIGIIQIVFGFFNVIGGLTIILAFKFVELFVPDPTVIKILDIISAPLAVMLFLFGGLMIAGAIALMNYKNWGKVVTLILGALGLLNIPLGTLKGVYIIWALVQPEIAQLFNQPSAKPAPEQN